MLIRLGTWPRHVKSFKSSPKRAADGFVIAAICHHFLLPSRFNHASISFSISPLAEGGRLKDWKRRQPATAERNETEILLNLSYVETLQLVGNFIIESRRKGDDEDVKAPGGLLLLTNLVIVINDLLGKAKSLSRQNGA
jgi:hypothetical protein